MATHPRPTYDPARFYLWRAPDETFSIHLSLDVVEKLNRELERAGAEDPPRDLNGVLLGRARAGSQSASVVEDIVIERGDVGSRISAPGQVDAAVSDMIWKLVREAGSGRHVVGFFRTQRTGTLAPNAWDLANATRLFGEPDNLMLLVQFPKPGAGEAAFFYWERGKTQPHVSGPPFPFDVAKLYDASPQAPKFVDPLFFNEPPPKKFVRVSGEPHVWMQLIPTFGIFAVLTLGIQMAWPSGSAEATPEVKMEAVNTMPLGLMVTARPHQLEIRWNHDSPHIQAAEKAVLRITEDTVTEEVPVPRQELRDGYVAYTPKTNLVDIRLEVSGPDGNSASESVHVVARP
jgi:hypothetical protein